MVSPDTDAVSRRNVLQRGMVASSVVLFGSAALGSAAASGSDQRNFVAHMSPDNAVPTETNFFPYDETNAQGQAKFQLDRSGDELSWKVNLANIEGVTGVHVHQGGPDENGPHLAELINPPAPSDEINGVYGQGTFGVGDTCGSDLNNCLTSGVTFETLVAAMRSGNAYVQVHAGKDVIRGQIQ